MRIGIRYKIFLIILLANALVASAIVFINNQAFNRGFNVYLAQVQSHRLAPVLAALSDIYGEHENWEWVQNNPRRWYRLVHHITQGMPARNRRRELVLLSDSSDNLLTGDPRLLRHAQWLPIEREGEVVGSLGVPKALRLGVELDALFASQQRRQLRWIALVTLVVSAALAIPFASRLLRPIARLKTAFSRLANDRLGTESAAPRLAVVGTDELADLARDFNLLADSLHRNQQSRERWIVDIAHELRTPVAVLNAELEALVDGVREANPETIKSLLQEIQRLSGLVNDLHDLSLSDAGALSCQSNEVNLVDIIKTVHTHFDGELTRRHLEWSLQVTKPAVTIKGDASRLSQLFTNLMQNSMRYTDGSADEPGYIKVTVDSTENPVQVSWADSSPGVPPDSIPMLFERLYRVDASRSRSSGGSGLGLSIVRSIAEAHQGNVVATASVLGGLEVNLTLPYAPEPPGERLQP